MRNLLFALCLTTLLCSCGGKDYVYADQLFDLYEETIEKYEDAENIDELNVARNEAFKAYQQIEIKEKASHKELTQDIEQYDEDAYLLHLELLTAESRAQWIYNKKRHELEQNKEK